MLAVFIGQALAGILSASLSIACMALTSSAILNGRVYFMTATLWTVASAALHVWLSGSLIARRLMLSTPPTRPPALEDPAATVALLADTGVEDEEDDGEVRLDVYREQLRSLAVLPIGDIRIVLTTVGQLNSCPFIFSDAVVAVYCLHLLERDADHLPCAGIAC